MKINATLPFDHTFAPDEFMTMDAVKEIGATVEKAGFNGGNVTDHPCPTARWVDAGGHDAQDPFVMLSLVAAHTTSLRLQTGIVVLPYRNPFVVARAASTLDVFSGGRLTLSFGAGYLKGEYFALGADFDARNDTMDEYLQAMKLAWTGEAFDFEGTNYSARGNRMRPAPVQKPHPPLYIGGNSKRAIRRVVELADGWNPFFTPAALSSTARTAAMSGEEDLIAGINYMKEHCEKTRRETLPEVFLASITQPNQPRDAQQLIDRIGRYKELGVSGVGMSIDGKTRAEWCDHAAWIGSEVIGKL